MTDKNDVQAKGGKPQGVSKSHDDPEPTGPPGGDEPPTSNVYLYSGLAMAGAWLLSPFVKGLNPILWWILLLIFLLIWFFLWNKNK